jgi:hypothetical protein
MDTLIEVVFKVGFFLFFVFVVRVDLDIFFGLRFADDLSFGDCLSIRVVLSGCVHARSWAAQGSLEELH